MFDENQLVKVKWANKTKRHYESKGYMFTKYGEEFEVKAKDLPNGSGVNVKVICDCCGKQYTTSYSNYNKHINNVDMDVCRNCIPKKAYKATWEQRAKSNFEKLRKFCDDNGYDLLTNEFEYSGTHMIIYYRCKKHGIQHGSLDNMIHGHGCIVCSYEKRGKSLRHSIDYVKDIVESVNNNKLLNPDDYIGANEHNLIVQCGSCGRKYETSFCDYIKNGQVRCASCSKKESYGEFQIRCFLECNKIKFEQEKRFSDCYDIKELPFDFYLPDYNMCIEFDGQQHFADGNGFGNYEYIARHDAMKNEFCKSHGINIIRIPYWHMSKIDEILKFVLCL